jgi:probable HAF family extracellular repeat protein
MRDFKTPRWGIVYLVAFALLLVSLPRPGAAQAAAYTVTDLGTLGGAESRAFGINHVGRVAGESDTSASPEPENPFSWTNGSMTDIGNFGSGGGAAHAVNDVGYAVGSADTVTSHQRAFIWSDIFGKRELGTFLGGNFAIALDINTANQVVGQADIGNAGNIQDRAFVWENSTGMQQIATLGGASNAGLGINNVGQIVGYSDTAGGETHGFLLSGGILTDIPTLGGRLGFAHEINDGGQVVGHSTLSVGPLNPPQHAFLWTAGAIPVDLGTLGGTHSFAYSINNLGEVVGSAQTADGALHAFIYSQSIGTMTDLNELTAGSGWTLVEARDINNQGKIVGYGINPSGLAHAFLLTPNVDEIPGGEPPPCSVGTSSPIILPQTTTKPIRQTKKMPAPVSGRRKPIYDILRL